MKLHPTKVVKVFRNLVYKRKMNGKSKVYCKI